MGSIHKCQSTGCIISFPVVCGVLSSFCRSWPGQLVPILRAGAQITSWSPSPVACSHYPYNLCLLVSVDFPIPYLLCSALCSVVFFMALWLCPGRLDEEWQLSVVLAVSLRSCLVPRPAWTRCLWISSGRAVHWAHLGSSGAPLNVLYVCFLAPLLQGWSLPKFNKRCSLIPCIWVLCSISRGTQGNKELINNVNAFHECNVSFFM